MPRVGRDIKDCLDFVSRQPWGRRADRERDIRRGFKEICLASGQQLHNRARESVGCLLGEIVTCAVYDSMSARAGKFRC